ncbi:MAG: hypothetical protein ACD_77C00187G0001 [uncultured bacterium]|nr:MAG: hypothetical protein ACD_77C00187G0001 [uncultured bacterium]
MKTFLKRLSLLFALLCPAVSSVAQQPDLEFFMPEEIRNFKSSVPSPKDHLGYEVGEQHVSYDQIVSYMRLLASKSDRVKLIESGYSYEKRQMVYLIISSPENLSNLESIRTKHLDLCNPEKSTNINVKEMPMVTWMGYSVHGNEASGINASLVVAYLLTASEDEFVKKILENNIIIFQPSINPDGAQRYAGWVNSNLTNTKNGDENSREFREPNPNGRSNHYWFDLNRDWLPVQHPESISRMELFYKWFPTMVNDYHEQGNTTTTFFSPGIKNSTNPLIPEENWELSRKISAYHSEMLSRIGAMHFSKEDFDDFYTGKGSTLPDLSGSIGLLYEQPNPRGVYRDREGVAIKLSDIVKRQVFCSISALKAAYELKVEMLDYQRRFFIEKKRLADSDPIKGYIFGDANDISLSKELFRILKLHNIKVYNLTKGITLSNRKYDPGSSFVVPVQQQQYTVIKTIFEKSTTFRDTTFYDISAWTIPLAMNINYSEIRDLGKLTGEEVNYVKDPVAKELKTGAYAYLFEIKDYYSYNFMYYLMSKGLSLKVGDKSFSFMVDGTEKSFEAGTVQISVQEQSLGKEDLNKIISTYNGKGKVSVYAVDGGLSMGDTDLGSSHFRSITKPRIAILTGRGASYGSIGELWHLLDFRFGIPVSLIDIDNIESMNLDRYNLIIINGAFKLSKEQSGVLAQWAKRNTIIATGAAFGITNELGISNIATVNDRSVKDSSTKGTYAQYLELRKTSRVNGVILNSTIDATNPLSFGINSNEIPLFKNRDIVISNPKNKYVTPMRYTEKPLLSGYLQDRYVSQIKGTPAVMAGKSLIYFADEPYFRAYWLGSSRLFMNALFFRELMVKDPI